MCDNPIRAYLCKNPKYMFGNFMVLTRQYREIVQLDKEYLFFTDKYLSRFKSVNEVWLPCGKCIQCLNKRSKDWEIRSIFEKNLHDVNCCLTLTYDDLHLKHCADFVQTDEGLVHIPSEKTGIAFYKDVQDFIKRIRKHFNFKREIRYMCSIEYGGTNTLRPHYHLILFGFCPDDLKLYKKTKKGTLLYKSKFLEEKWSNGFVDVGKCDIQSCRYVAQYCCKGLLKERKTANSFDKFILKHKNMLSRECLHASLGLGIGSFIKNYHSIISSNCIKYGKFVYSIPRYFMKKLEQINIDLFTKVHNIRHKFWLEFKNTDDDKRRARIRSDNLLDKLNLFRSDLVHCII